jgi:hypothetical protein
VIHKGDVGVEISIDLGENVSSSTTHALLYKKPSGATGAFAGAVADGQKVKYVTTSAIDLDEEGTWATQAHVVMTGRDAHSDIFTFEVGGNL